MSMIFFNTELIEEVRQDRGLSRAKLSLMLTEKKKDRPPRANFIRELISNGGMCQSLENASLLVNWYGSLDCISHCDEPARNELESRLEEYKEEQKYIAEHEFDVIKY